MITLNHASTALYNELKREYGNRTFKGGMSFDEYFSKRFDFAPSTNNPGWSQVDDGVLEYAYHICEDDVV